MQSAKLKKKTIILSLMLMGTIVAGVSMSAIKSNANDKEGIPWQESAVESDEEKNEEELIDEISGLPIIMGGTDAGEENNLYEGQNPFNTRTKDKNYANVPKGVLYSNAWRSTKEEEVGNTVQWDYQVSAQYDITEITDAKKKKKYVKENIEYIKTEWVVSAAMRNSATMTIGVSGDGFSASAGSSWQIVKSKPKHWTNTKNPTDASWRQNIIITPSKHYDKDSIGIVNTATLKVKNRKKPYVICAGV